MLTRRVATKGHSGIVLGIAAIAGLLSAVSPAPAAPASSFTGNASPVARWKMDEGAGTTLTDSSGSGNSGTLVGGVSWASGQFGNGLSFDGSSGYVSAGVTNLPAANAAQTISWWMNYPSVPSGSQDAVVVTDTTSSSIQCGFRGGNVVVWKLGGTTLVSAPPPSANAWHHFGYTFDGTIHTLYVDGISVNTSTTAPNTAVPTAVNLGRWPGGSEFYSGKLDEVRIYNRTLSAAEMVGLAGEGPLEGLWHVDEGSGTTTADTSSNGNTGTLSSGVTWTTGQVGNALNFNGTTGSVNLGSNLTVLTNAPAATLACWIKIGTLPASGATMELISISRNNGSTPTSQSRAHLKIVGTGTAAQVGGGGRSNDTEGIIDFQETGTNLAAGTWYHVAAVIDYTGKTISTYVNGSPAGSVTAAFAANVTPNTTSTSNALGSEDDASGAFYNGAMDEVRIYSRALSASEIAGLAGGTGTGVSAVYYNTQTFSGTFLQRTDSQINFNWGTGSPDPSIGADNFSVVWTGQVQPQYSETYTFYPNTDDGVKLWVNGQLLVDFPQNQSITERSGAITLTGGSKVDLRMEYFENTGQAQAELRWSSTSTPKAIIPQSQLYPTYAQTPIFQNATAQAGALTTVYLRFNEAMDLATSTATSNYTVSGGLTVTNATLSADRQVVTLTTSGNVAINTTTVTASANLKSIDRKSLTQTVKTIVAGNTIGISDSTAVTMSLSTDSNQSVIQQQGVLGGFDIPNSGIFASLTLSGTVGTQVTLMPFKLQGGTSEVTFNSSGGPSTVTITLPATVNVYAKTTGSFAKDFKIQAIVSGQVQGEKPATVVNLNFSVSPPHFYMIDQRGISQTATVQPVIQGLTFGTPNLFVVNRSGHATPGPNIGPSAFPATDATGAVARMLQPIGAESYVISTTTMTGMQGNGCYCKTDEPKKPKHCENNIGSDPAEDGGTQNGQSCTCHCDPEVTGDDEGDKNKVPTQDNGNHEAKPVVTPGSVDPGDGEKKISSADLVIRGRGLDFVFRRVYRGFNYRKALGKPTDFGENWIFSYNDDYLVKDGTGADNVSHVINYRDGGWGGLFQNLSAGQWESPLQQFVQLRMNVGGDFEIREETGFVRSYFNFSTVSTPNKNGRLKSIRDRNDNKITFFYEQIDPDSNVSGDQKYVLAYAIDTLGREIRYQYYARTAQTINGRQVTIASTSTASFGRLARVVDFKDNMTFSASPTQVQDFPGQTRNRTLVYDYDSEGNLVRCSLPAVTGTPNGNDFPNGKTTRYKYIVTADLPGGLSAAQQASLLHKLTRVWYPNEVGNNPGTNPADASAAQVLTYITDKTNPFFGFASSYTIGGTNGNGVPAGGTIAYTWTDLNPTRQMVNGVATDSTLLTVIKSLQLDAVDRNGNTSRYIYGGSLTLLEYRQFPRGLRAGEPAEYLLTLTQDQDRLMKATTSFEGMVKTITRVPTTDRFQQSNIARIVRTPGPRAADQAKIEEVHLYEPVYNHKWLSISARGADMTNNGFTPPLADPAGRTMTDPYDNTKTLNLRYAVVSYYDYQESTEKASQAPGNRLRKDGSGLTVNTSPLIGYDPNVLTTEVWLVENLGLPEDSSGSGLVALRSRLSANLVSLGLGDLNGDGDTTPRAAGNMIRRAYGSPVLLTGSNQHALETAIDPLDLIDQTKTYQQGGTNEGSQGARLQTIVWLYQYNDFGNLTKVISPEGNVTALTFFPENDPDGDSIVTPTPADGRTLSTVSGALGGGYVRDMTWDTSRSYVQQTSGTLLAGTFSNNNTNPPQSAIQTQYAYDDVGNLIRVITPRGIRTDSFVNELDRTLQITYASDISGASSASPSDPLVGASIAPLTAFAYVSRWFFDFNGMVVLWQVEDRGNTSNLDGMGLGTLPAQATSTTPGLASADPAGGTAFADTLNLYDQLNDLIETRTEVDATRSLNTRYRFDATQQKVLAIYPEGNADSALYDERLLRFQYTRGTSSRPNAGLYAPGDPSSFNRPGGAGTVGSTITYNYDKDRNLTEFVDAADNGGEKSSIAPVGAGAGDVIRYAYDGFNRLKTITDALDNRTTYTYDPSSNVVRTVFDGDPSDDGLGGVNNKTLLVHESIFDELSRTIITHRVLFQTPGSAPLRNPVLTDGPLMNAFLTEGYLSDANSNAAAVPGTTGITVLGRVSRIVEYDRESRLTFVIEDSFHDSRADYDGVGRRIKATDSALSNGFSGSAFNPSNISGNLLEMAFDGDHNTIERKETDVTTVPAVSPEVFRWTFLYDSLDRLQTVVDNVGRTGDFRYDSRSNRVAQSDAVSSGGTRTINRRGLGSTASVSANTFGNVRRWTYDGHSRTVESEIRLTATGQGDGTNIGATLEGVKSTAPSVDAGQSGDGLISGYFAYDDNSLILAFRDDDGNTTQYIYDNQNRPLKERKGVVITGTAFSISGGDSGAFNVALRGGVAPVVRIPGGTDITRTYDQDSNLTSLLDEAGNSFVNAFDARNRRKTCTVTLAPTFSVGTSKQTYTFDGLSRVTRCFDNNDPNPASTSNGVTCSYFYDSLSRRVEEQCQIGSLGTKATSYSYEISCSCGAVAVTLPTEITYPDGRGVHNDYDNLDRLVSRNDGNDGDNPPIGTYQYIGKNRVAVLTYQNNARLTHIGQSGGQNADLGFDAARRVVNHRWETFATSNPAALGAGTLVLGFEVQDANGVSLYDGANNKKIEYKTHDPTNSEQFKYDSAYRLTSTGGGSQGINNRGFERGTFASNTRTTMSSVAFFQDWDLDGLGNWVRLDNNDGGSGVETRTHSDFNDINSRVIAGNTSTLTYDLNGNAIDTGYSSLGSRSFPGGGLGIQYDAFNRAVNVYSNGNSPGTLGAQLGHYVYDCMNRRRRKVANPGASQVVSDFYYDGWKVVEEHDGSDAITNQYTYGNYVDEVWTLDNRRNGGSVANLNDHSGVLRHFYLSNALFHVYGIMNEGGGSNPPGTLQEAYQYDAYGRQTVITNSGGTVLFNATDTRTAGGASTINGSPYMFTGQRFDQESGLLYCKNRYMSQGLGRFLTRDPAGVLHDNPYEYVVSNPAMGLDPLGLQVISNWPGGDHHWIPKAFEDKLGPCKILMNTFTTFLTGDQHYVTTYLMQYSSAFSKMLDSCTQGGVPDCCCLIMGAEGLKDMAIKLLAGAMLNVDDPGVHQYGSGKGGKSTQGKWDQFKTDFCNPSCPGKRDLKPVYPPLPAPKPEPKPRSDPKGDDPGKWDPGLRFPPISDPVSKPGLDPGYGNPDPVGPATVTGTLILIAIAIAIVIAF